MNRFLFWSAEDRTNCYSSRSYPEYPGYYFCQPSLDLLWMAILTFALHINRKCHFYPCLGTLWMAIFMFPYEWSFQTLSGHIMDAWLWIALMLSRHVF